MAELAWHVEAVDDLDAAAAYIARDSQISATQFTTRIVSAVDRLRDHPQLGRVVPEIADDSYRELIFQNYRIVYRPITPQRVVVLGVVHAAMDMERQIGRRDWDIT